MTKPNFNTEQWLRTAVEQLDKYVFDGELDLARHPYQIYFGRVKGKKMGETVQPSDNEDITLDDFFPTTIGVNFELKEKELMAALAYECIKAFFNISKGKRFKKLCERFNFEPPYTKPEPTPYLADLLNDALKATVAIAGEFPGKAVKFPTKKQKDGEKKPTRVVFFCPECGLEYSVPAKKLKDNQGTPTCICGAKCGRDLEA